MKEALVADRSRRLARVEVSPEMLLDLLQVPAEGIVVGNRRITVDREPIPLTATALRAGITEFGNIVLLIEDDSFDPVPEGHMTPRIEPWYTSKEVG